MVSRNRPSSNLGGGSTLVNHILRKQTEKRVGGQEGVGVVSAPSCPRHAPWNFRSEGDTAHAGVVQLVGDSCLRSSTVEVRILSPALQWRCNLYEYRIVDAKWGSWWPETYVDGQDEFLSGDLEFLREKYPDNTFFVERREVGEWDANFEMAESSQRESRSTA